MRFVLAAATTVILLVALVVATVGAAIKIKGNVINPIIKMLKQDSVEVPLDGDAVPEKTDIGTKFEEGE